MSNLLTLRLHVLRFAGLPIKSFRKKGRIYAYVAFLLRISTNGRLNWFGDVSFFSASLVFPPIFVSHQERCIIRPCIHTYVHTSHNGYTVISIYWIMRNSLSNHWFIFRLVCTVRFVGICTQHFNKVFYILWELMFKKRLEYFDRSDVYRLGAVKCWQLSNLLSDQVTICHRPNPSCKWRLESVTFSHPSPKSGGPPLKNFEGASVILL